MSADIDQVVLKIDRILLATDFSPGAGLAARYARAIAERFASTATLVHVIDHSVAGRSIEEMRHAAGEKLEELLKGKSFAGIPAMAHTLESRDPAAAIVALADAESPVLTIGPV
jgi:nucleotide-binding universal stress UspA family protein